MFIDIMSRPAMASEMVTHPGQDLIVIQDPDEEQRNPPLAALAQVGRDHAKSSLTLHFWDASLPRDGLCTKDDILKAIEFGKDKEIMICACAGGISRSSAIAYIIMRSKCSKEDSLKILSFVHYPNIEILTLGQEILGFPLIEEITSAGLHVNVWQ